MASSEDGAGMSQPLLWVIIPLIAVFSAGCFMVYMWTRHVRKRNPRRHGWPEDLLSSPNGFLSGRSTRRWAPWTGTRSVEGLNELGEAPPPYEAESPPPPPPPPPNENDGAIAARLDTDAAGPPEYGRPASPRREQFQAPPPRVQVTPAALPQSA